MSDQVYYHSYLNRDRLIHIVDTDPATCEALSVLFRLEGFQTVFSLEAGHFSISMERRRPDIVVLNLKVGEESGLGLLRRVKALRTGTPVFMLADEPQVDAAVMAMKLGASDVITKPIDTEHLLTVIRDALRRDVHLGAMQGGRWRCAAFPSSPRASARCSNSSPTASPTRKRAASWAFPRAPSRSIAPASWKSSVPATPPISCASC